MENITKSYENKYFFKSLPFLEKLIFDELGLFLALTTPENELEEADLAKYCPARRSTRGRPPTLKATGTVRDSERRWQNWRRSEELPMSLREMRRMTCYAVGISIKYTMKNHVFKFNNKIYKQPEGGAIGVGIAGDVAVLFMVWYDQQLLKSLNACKIEIQLFARYVDDINIVAKMLQSDNNDEPADKRTMLRVQEIANKIHSSIQVTIDYPSGHINRRMPVLDVEQWIQPVEINNKIKSQVLHSHYSKPMSSKHVINKSSALPMSSKLNILIADLIRIMRNVSEKCISDEREKHIQLFMHRMQYSGYNQADRIAVYNKARSKFTTMVQDDKDGKAPLYRGKMYNQLAREKDKVNKRKNWYAKGGHETVMFVDSTPGSRLAKEFTQILDSCDLKIRVVERTGESIKNLLTRSDPFQVNQCAPGTCEICTSFPKISCKTRETVYKVICKTCGEFYIGETSRSIAERFKEHCSLQGKETSVFAPHFKLKHGGIQQPLELKLLKTCPGDPMMRQVTEAVHIAYKKPTLNTKMEWRRQVMQQGHTD